MLFRSYQLFHFQEGKELFRCAKMDGDPEYKNNDYLCFPSEKAGFYLNELRKEGLN